MWKQMLEGPKGMARLYKWIKSGGGKEADERTRPIHPAGKCDALAEEWHARWNSEGHAPPGASSVDAYSEWIPEDRECAP